MVAPFASLSPCTPYVYHVTCCDATGATCNTSATYNFSTAPDASCARSPVNVSWAVFGDMGTVVPFGYAVTKMIAQGVFYDLLCSHMLTYCTSILICLISHMLRRWMCCRLHGRTLRHCVACRGHRLRWCEFQGRVGANLGCLHATS